jgi:hypothetical protein
VLGQIWQLADLDGDNQLSKQEFLIAMHLITLCREVTLQTVSISRNKPSKKK